MKRLLLIPLGLVASHTMLPCLPAQDATSLVQPASEQADDDQSETAGVSKPNVTMEAVRATLRDLEADQLATRDAAEKRLLEMGSNVIPFLPPVTPRTSGELKVRLQRIRQALQDKGIETFFQPTKVTLQGEMKLSQVLESIERQTGNVIELQSQDASASTTIDIEWSDRPFWSAMDEIMDQANLRINAFGSTQGNLVVSPGGAPSSTEPFVNGPFRIDLVSVQTRRLFNSQFEGQLDISFQVVWEPRLKPVFMQIPMASVQLLMPDGNTLSALNPQAAPEVPLNLGSCATQVDLQVQRPQRTVQKIESLKGEVVIAIPSQRHQYAFEKFGNGARQQQKFGDVSVTLEGARHNGAVYEMRIMVEFGEAQGALESFRGWILSNEAYLLDANEKRLENVGLNTYAIRPNGVGIAYLFQINANPDDYKLIYETPAAISKQTIAYELKDIELP